MKRGSSCQPAELLMSIEFEGRLVPDDLLAAMISADTRPWLVRAAVCHPQLAAEIGILCEQVLTDDTASSKALGASIQTAHALMIRRLTPLIAAGIETGRWRERADPTQPGASLLRSALACIVDIARPDAETARRAIRHCLTVHSLRAHAWRATQPSDIEAILKNLTPLLQEAPALAPEVATRLALLHPERCLEAAHCVAALEIGTRRAFADALEKQLKRVFAIKRWVECRRALFGA